MEKRGKQPEDVTARPDRDHELGEVLFETLVFALRVQQIEVFTDEGNLAQ
ncbi:hypothetical protein AB0F96_07910 [Streptomyces sp. NPDC023998]